MKYSILLTCILVISIIPSSFAQTLEISTNSKVYTDEQPLFVFGQALPGENLILRIFAPDGTITKFDQIDVDPDDGSFSHSLLIWPESSVNFPYGTYTIEAISMEQNGFSKKIDVKFTSTAELEEVPVDRQVNTLVFAPETSAVNAPLRIFAQTTSDGLLIGGDPDKLLETTHVHLPDGTVETLSASFQTLHQGLYFVDYTPTQLGTYVFHVVTFHQGTVSHGSAATIILSQDIGGISEQIVKLNSILDETSGELDRLKSEIRGFSSTLEGSSEKIESSVTAMSTSVTNIEEASVQLNSLFFPIVGSIGIIVALQIVILARRR